MRDTNSKIRRQQGKPTWISWELIAFIMLIATIPVLSLIATNLYQIQKFFGGHLATAYVDSKYSSSNLGVRGGFDYHMAQVSFIADDGSLQSAELSLDWPTYNSATAGTAIEIVYNPGQPHQAYATTGQAMPRSWSLPLKIVTALAFVSVIERYRKTLFKKIKLKQIFKRPI